MSNPQRKRNLIVNYIPSGLEESYLYNLFAMVGPIKSLRIMRNADGTGKGYGFVEYEDHLCAEKAIEQFDRLVVQNKRLKVAFARPGGTREGCNLFVKNLPKTWTTERLTMEFGRYGDLLESRVLSTNDDQSRRCGFVRFDLPRDAQNAIRAMNGHIPHDGDFQIKVTHATKRRPARGKYDYNDTMSIKSDTENEYERTPTSRMTPYSQSMNGQDTATSSPAPSMRGNHQYSDYAPHPYYSRPYEIYRNPYGYGMQNTSEVDWRRSQYEAAHYETQMDQYQYFQNQERNHPAATGALSRLYPVDTEEEQEPDAFRSRSKSRSKNGSSSKSSNEFHHNGNNHQTPTAPVVQENDSEQTEEDLSIMLMNLPTFMEELHLQHLCGKYGKVVKIDIQRDNNANSLGCAEVTFETGEEKKRAWKGLDGCEMCNKIIICH